MSQFSSADDLRKWLAKDPDGLMTYEVMANHVNELDEIMPLLVDNMIVVDRNGRFSVSAARYLTAIDRQRFAPFIDRLIDHAIESDREHQFIGDLLPSIWGSNYAEHADTLAASDRNFRRIYRRVTPSSSL